MYIPDTEFELMLGSVDTSSMHSICVLWYHAFIIGLNVSIPLYTFVCTGVERCWKKLISIFVFMATVMYFLIAIVWIVAFTTYTQCKLDLSI